VSDDERADRAEQTNGDDELARLHDTFRRGDYLATREGARRLAATTDDEAVRTAARELSARTEASGAMIALYLLAAAVVLTVSGYWLVHGR
jgi:hypothetical protein